MAPYVLGLIVRDFFSTMVVVVVVVYFLLLTRSLKPNPYHRKRENTRSQVEIIQKIMKVEALVNVVHAKVSELEERFKALQLQNFENEEFGDEDGAPLHSMYVLGCRCPGLHVGQSTSYAGVLTNNNI